MTAILSLMATIFKSKWARYGVLILALLCGLYVGADRVRDSIYQQGFNAGVAKQEQVYVQTQAKAKQQFDVLQAQADQDRQTLNNKIASLSSANADLKKQLKEKETKINQEKTDYAKTSAGSMSCFAPRDDGLRIINNSFPTNFN